MKPIAPEIFKAYDIRGIVDRTLTEEAAHAIGRGLATMGRRKSVAKFVVGRDGRLSGPRLAAALARGMNAAGADVVDIGVVATPMVYFATHLFATGSGVMVTGSHNPPEYNGLKMMVAGDTLAAESIQDLRRLIEHGEFTAGGGKLEAADVCAAYLDRIASDVKPRAATIMMDCGTVARRIARALPPPGCSDEFLRRGRQLSNHHPIPPRKTRDLIPLSGPTRRWDSRSTRHDRPWCRHGVGKIICPPPLMLFAADVGRSPGGRSSST